MERKQRVVSEMPHLDSCKDCRFLTQGCTVPGGICVFREIKGVLGPRVGDLLENVGIIQPGWDVVQAATPPGN